MSNVVILSYCVQIDDTFLAAYQASYGVPQPETTPTDPTIPAVPPPVQTQGPTGPPGQQNTSEEKVSSSSMGISLQWSCMVQYMN